MKKYLCLLLLFTVSLPAFAQQNRIIPVESPVYEYISNLQHRGYLSQLNPMALPYTEGRVLKYIAKIDNESLDKGEQHWLHMIEQYLRPQRQKQHEMRYGVDFKAGSYIGNSRRKNMLRPVGDDLFAYPNASLGGYIESDHFVGNATIRHDLYYDRDPDGMDAARRLYIRSEDAYIGYNSDLLRIYLGRFDNHWAPYGQTSTVLSANPRSFDQLNIRFGNEKIALRSVFGELDNLSADSTFTGTSKGLGAISRYFVAHRLDWRPSNTFGMALFESVVYSGAGSSISLKYLNPLHTLTFVTDNKPKNNEVNLLLGGMFWLQGKGLTWHNQITVDDFQHEDYIERNIFTFVSSLHKAEVFPNVDLGLDFEAIFYQAYNTHQAEGRYIYLNRGLATQFNDYILGAVYVNIFMPEWIPGLRITPKLQLLLQGEQTINQPFVETYPDGSPLDYVLTGQEEQTFRPSLSFRYQRSPHFWIKGDLGANFVQDYRNQLGVDDSRFVGSLSLGIDFSLLKGR